jgi:hypothetical protein
VLGVRLQQPPSVRELHLVTEAGENILEGAPRRRVVEDLVPRDHRDRELRCALLQARFLPRLLDTAVARRDRVQAVGERFLQPVPDEERVGFLHEEAALPAPERDQVVRVLVHLAPTDDARSFFRAAPAGRDQAAEVRVPRPPHREQHDRRSVVDRDLGADQELDAGFPSGDVRLDDPIDAVAVGDRYGGESERGSCGD